MCGNQAENKVHVKHNDPSAISNGMLEQWRNHVGLWSNPRFLVSHDGSSSSIDSGIINGNIPVFDLAFANTEMKRSLIWLTWFYWMTIHKWSQIFLDTSCHALCQICRSRNWVKKPIMYRRMVLLHCNVIVRRSSGKNDCCQFDGGMMKSTRPALKIRFYLSCEESKSNYVQGKNQMQI